MSQTHFYSIGTPGQKWTQQQVQQWCDSREIQRSYNQEVVSKMESIASDFEKIKYGELDYPTGPYPLFGFKSKQWSDKKPTVLVTGGVHGYETSGVQGALLFLEEKAAQYLSHFNLIVAPCVSPWGYEVINRWNPKAVDPNRSFIENSPAPEAAMVMQFVQDLNVEILAHIDLHETTDSDEDEFRPALAARDGLEYCKGSIPDGFYTVGDTENPCEEMQAAIIASVAKVTHIAPADPDGTIIGSEVVQHGVINYPLEALGLCAGFSKAKYTTTTEVYPDSTKATAEECNQAQVAAIVGMLDYLKAL
ncbi:peptidase [Vibrio sp. UCD-FRSSP16_10]|uniref:M14 family metallopeptidase n=1 Tax=unclassified Vibrio TaxID=2614977 RepID=UPI0007FF8E65|nr:MULTISPECIES: M14 family metallocarboxypeptidase [unclassified Vibrio]OBT16790.1 peptidase [Vibrio sp. UCD-FRSSP16_30]OBT21417.1 peptidase [Vibrio sp. UCD-FRSSP16_10]